MDRLEVRWPDGSEEMLEDLAAGSYYRSEQRKGIAARKGFAGAGAERD